MKRWRNTTQMKEQTRNKEVQVNEDETGKIPEEEFRIMIVKMIKKLENKMEKMQESINKDLEELNNKHTKTNNTITEIKNTLEGINSRTSDSRRLGQWISWKVKWWKQLLQRKKKKKVKIMKRTEDSFRDLWDNIKFINIQIRVFQKRRDKKEYEKFLDENS